MVGCELGQVTWQQEAPASVPAQVQGSRPAERWNSAPPNRSGLAQMIVLILLIERNLKPARVVRNTIA